MTSGTAATAPSGTESAQDTINRLEANGYRVILNKIGGASLDHCTVTGVRPGRDITRQVTDSGGDKIDKVLAA